MPSPYSRELIELYRAIVEWARRTLPFETAGRSDWEVIEYVSYLSI